MALTYEIDPVAQSISILRSHNPPFDEWRIFMERLMADPRFQPGMSIVEDRRGDQDVPSRSEIEVSSAWVRANARRLGHSRWAVVIDPTSPATFGMIRVGEFLTDHSGVWLRGFTCLDSARAWASGAVVPE